MKALLLRLLRVPEQPSPPPGSRGGLETFRADRAHLYYLGFKWGLRQVSALISILVSLAFLGVLELGWLPDFLPFAQVTERVTEELADEDIEVGLAGVRVGMALPDLIGLIELFAIGTFLVQLFFSGLLIKLGWEMRWYMVSETTVRIREGLVKLREQTFTVANIQNMKVQQGPLQRVFGIYDLEVQTAGGAGGSELEEAGKKGENLHVGRFRGLKDPERLRDRLRRRLSEHGGAGLGDPDEARQRPASVPLAAPDDLLAAARALQNEAAALRRAVATSSSVVGPS